MVELLYVGYFISFGGTPEDLYVVVGADRRDQHPNGNENASG